MARLRLLGARLVVAPLAAPKASVEADIVHPAKYYDDRKRWEVLEIGPGRLLKNGKREPLPMKAGDWVILAEHEPEFEWKDGVQVVKTDAVLAFWSPVTESTQDSQDKPDTVPSDSV